MRVQFACLSLLPSSVHPGVSLVHALSAQQEAHLPAQTPSGERRVVEPVKL